MGAAAVTFEGLDNARLAQSDAAVAQHNRIRTFIVRRDERNGLRVEIREFQSALIVLEALMQRREGLDEIADLEGLQTLFRTGVRAGDLRIDPGLAVL